MKKTIQYKFVEDCTSCVSYELLYAKIDKIVNMLRTYGLVVTCTNIEYKNNRYYCCVNVIKSGLFPSKKEIDTLVGKKGIYI